MNLAELKAEASKCQFCGFCEFACSTYRSIRMMHFGPRGRVNLIRNFDGELSEPPRDIRHMANNSGRPAAVAWASLLVFVAVMGLWASPISPLPKMSVAVFSVPAYSQILGKKVAVSYAFNPFATGTAALVAWLVSLAVMRPSGRVVKEALATTVRQTWAAVAVGAFVVSLAFVFNYSGMAYSLAYMASFAGILFILISPFLGWLGAALTGSNTSSNALFGALQYTVGNLLGIPPLLLPAVQSVGAELGKPVAPQTVSAGISTTEYVRREGDIIRNNLPYSISLVLLLVAIAVVHLLLYPYPFKLA
ncbi:MAG: L-lactate permease [Thermoproteus sp.]